MVSTETSVSKPLTYLAGSGGHTTFRGREWNRFIGIDKSFGGGEYLDSN